MKKSNQAQKYAKLASYVAVVAYFIAIWTKGMAATMLESGNANDGSAVDAFTTISAVAAWAFVLFGLLVVHGTQGRYLPMKSSNFLKSLDERQRALRAHVVEWAYRALGVWAVITLLFGNIYSEYSRGFMMLLLAGLFIFMPSLVAAHRKGA